MSGVYLIVLIVVWLWLTRLLWKGGRRFLEASFANRPVRIGLVIIVAALWFGGAFWEVTGKKMYWDAKVRELCAKDGGVRVYETVKLPAEKYNLYARKNWILPNKSQLEPLDEYFLDSEITYIKEGNPSLWQIHHKVIRRYDQKILGEAIMFARSGGDLPGPWHGSSFKCPEPSLQPSIESTIFHKEVMK